MLMDSLKLTYKRIVKYKLDNTIPLQQNSIAKQYNQTVVDIARTMLHVANMSYSFWAEAVSTAVYM